MNNDQSSEEKMMNIDMINIHDLRNIMELMKEFQLNEVHYGTIHLTKKSYDAPKVIKPIDVNEDFKPTPVELAAWGIDLEDSE